MLQSVLIDEGSASLHVGDFVLLEETFNTLGKGSDDTVFVLLDFRPVDRAVS